MAKALALTLLALCAACTTEPAVSPAASATGAESSEPSVSPVPSLAGAPSELLGSWQATISTGEDVVLELRPSGYTVNRGGAVGSGSIEVDGDSIVFASARCELGPGEYRWSIDGDTLTFTPIEPRDPCGNRIIFLEGATYTRVE